jgi:dTDP-glucose 4,6-dehydratase
MARTGILPLRTAMALALSSRSSATNHRPTPKNAIKLKTRQQKTPIARILKLRERQDGKVAESRGSVIGNFRMLSRAADVVNPQGSSYTVGLITPGGCMRAVVTGGAGFLGSHLCDKLLAEGWEVLALDNLITGARHNLSHLKSNRKFKFQKADVSKPLKVAGKVGYVLHFASPASPPDYLKHPIATMMVGSIGTKNALDLALAKKAKFFLASTSECYGDPEVTPQHEEYWGHVNPIGPRGVYDEAKRFSEAMTMAYHRYHKVDTHIVRIFNTYGPRMRLNDGRALPNFVFQALSGRPLTIYGDGKQTRSFCYVSDLIEGIYRLMMSKENLPTNIGNPQEITILEFAERIRKNFENPPPIVFKPLPEDDPKRRCPDISKARCILNWEPNVDLEEGLRRTLAYFKQVFHKK